MIVLPQDTYQKEGYILSGWSDGTKTYAAGTYYEMGTTDVTLTAVWEKSCKKFLFISEGSQTENAYYASGSTIVLPEKEREGYVFKGWKDGSKIYARRILSSRFCGCDSDGSMGEEACFRRKSRWK